MAICVHTPTGTTGATLLGGKLLSDVAGVTTCKSFGSRPASPRRTKKCPSTPNSEFRELSLRPPVQSSLYTKASTVITSILRTKLGFVHFTSKYILEIPATTSISEPPLNTK